MGKIWLFLRGLASKWWTLMSCAVFTALTFWQAHSNKSNEWLVHYLFFAAFVMGVFSAFLFWLDERRGRLNCESDLEVAINKDRPEVFVTLIFGPGNSGVGSVGIRNHGVRDARNIQIEPISIEGKTLAFKPLLCLTNAQERVFMAMDINGVTFDEEDALRYRLRDLADRSRRDSLEFEMKVQWSDSSGNAFSSASRAVYERRDERCRTVTGPVRCHRRAPQA